ncbi:YojF family protein [Virgibacillus sp. MSP4-1]|uniref:YojF family protein n=1 Tax=Virgibacillus sp. MSP4-1 TaxID=2700081 RepID=UPI00039B9568|nr:YojF family protein [Virgibacillus sp. MSP4-1]QHS23260.1 YojF family protein [Virgibacillus sp. MSP4-1]
MKAIEMGEVQKALEQYAEQDVYIHVETTNGAYAKHFDRNAHNVGAYVRNAQVQYTQAKIVDAEDAFRVGLKMEKGWIYAEGLTDWEWNEKGELLLAGHDAEGRLMVALQISKNPFRY